MVRLFCLSTSLFLPSFGFVSSFSSSKREKRKEKKNKKKKLKNNFSFHFCRLWRKTNTSGCNTNCYLFLSTFNSQGKCIGETGSNRFVCNEIFDYILSELSTIFHADVRRYERVKTTAKKTKQKWNCCKSPRFRFRCVYGLPVVVKRVYFLGVC